MTQTQNKAWYNLRGLEYSTDFNFFIKEQIFHSRTEGFNNKFNCRLESVNFKTIGHWDNFTQDKIKEICFDIHKKLLSGEYGEGKFVD